MSDDHLTTEEECPDCKGFDRCDFHEGVRRGRQQIENGNSVALDDCENSLEPAAWLYDRRYEDDEDFDDTWTTEILTKEKPTVYGELREHVAGTPHTRNVEPLVRPTRIFDRLIEIVEEHRHRAEDAAAAGNEKERYACESVADVIYDEVMQWKLQIKEFTQLSEAE